MSSLFEEDETSEPQKDALGAIGNNQAFENGSDDGVDQADSDVPDIVGLEEEELSDGITEPQDETPDTEELGESRKRGYGEEHAPTQYGGQIKGYEEGSNAGSIMSIPDDTPSIQVRFMTKYWASHVRAD